MPQCGDSCLGVRPGQRANLFNELDPMSRLFDAMRHVDVAESNATPVKRADTEPTVPNGCKVLTRIALKPESHILRTTDRQNSAREHFKYLEHKLRGLRKMMPLKRILITSSSPKEGKTVVATNLATTLATGTSRVLLVDGDMRARANRNLFGLGEAPGFADALEGRREPGEVLAYLEDLNIYYVPSGVSSISPGDLLQGDRPAAFLRTADHFDWVVIDSPPVATFADALSLATHADAVVIVVRAGVTARQDLEATVAALQDSGATIAAVILNACDQPGMDNGRYVYYQGPKNER